MWNLYVPYLGALPDGLEYVGPGKFAITEVKCPYKHINSKLGRFWLLSSSE